MTRHGDIEERIADVEQAVADGLAYFAGLDYESQPDAEWVLRHMVFWHRASVEGMESVLAGGPPFPHTWDRRRDERLGRARTQPGSPPLEIVVALRDLHARMVAAVRKFDDPEVTVVVLHDGTERPASQRLRMTAFHWKGHLSEFRS